MSAAGRDDGSNMRRDDAAEARSRFGGDGYL
jgi:hypothetical protein